MRTNLRFRDFAQHNGNFHVRNGDFFVRNGDFHVRNGDFHARNGDFHACNGHFYVRNGDSRACNGDFHLCNGSFHARNRDFHVRKGDFYACNGDFHVRNGDFRVRYGDFHARYGDLHACNGDFRVRYGGSCLGNGEDEFGGAYRLDARSPRSGRKHKAWGEVPIHRDGTPGSCQERLTEPAERAIARAKTVPSISESSSTAVARLLRGLVSFICLGPGVSLAALASPQALCWRALRALLVNVSECVKYIISNSEVQLLSFAAARRGPQLRFRPAVSSKKQR